MQKVITKCFHFIALPRRNAGLDSVNKAMRAQFGVQIDDEFLPERDKLIQEHNLKREASITLN